MYQACFLSLPGVSKDQQVHVINCIMGDGTNWDTGRANDATLRVRDEALSHLSLYIYQLFKLNYIKVRILGQKMNIQFPVHERKWNGTRFNQLSA